MEKKLTVFRQKPEWAEIKGTGVSGIVVCRFNREGKVILGIDVNGEGAIFYVESGDAKKLPSVKLPEKKTA